jgi:hypothetical protein
MIPVVKVEPTLVLAILPPQVLDAALSAALTKQAILKVKDEVAEKRHR